MARDLDSRLESIEGLFDSIEKLLTGVRLLDRVWTCIGPYDEKKILEYDEKLLRDLREFFNYDDSE